MNVKLGAHGARINSPALSAAAKRAWAHLLGEARPKTAAPQAKGAKPPALELGRKGRGK